MSYRKKNPGIVLWIDGVKFNSMTSIYCELGASTPERMKEVRGCIETGSPYKGRKLIKEEPKCEKKPGHEPKSGQPLLSGLCTHRFGANPGRHE